METVPSHSYFHKMDKDDNLTDIYLRRTNSKVAGYLYHEMKIFDHVCKNNNINYWAEGGTLLGAIRNTGLIPWDDDLDVQLAPGDEGVLETEEVTKQFHERGFELRPIWFGYKLCPKDLPSFGRLYKEEDFTGEGWLGTYPWPFLDIFLTTYDLAIADKIIYRSDVAQGWYPNFHFWDIELFPLKRIRFGPIEINVPQNPYPYLTRVYGSDWNEYALEGMDHSTGKRNPHPIKVKIVTRTPAEYEFSEIP